MNVDEVERFPALAAEREWLAEAVAREPPVLGICLGAQLPARALGAEVRPGEEIGFGARRRAGGDAGQTPEPGFTAFAEIVAAG